MNKKGYCYNCDIEVELKKEKIKTNYSYRGKNFEVEEEVLVCSKCDKEIFNDETLDSSFEKIYNEYLKIYNLSFARIKEIRKELKLSQDKMSKILNWSKKSIVRYENAESIPQGEYLNMYITLNENPFYIIKVLERNKIEIGLEEYYKILHELPFFDEYKTINAALYLLKDNELCETSLMKNMFVADFDSFYETGNSITNLEYVHMPFGPVVNNRNKLYNRMIRNDYIEIDIEETSTKFRTNFEYDKNLFTQQELEILKKVKNKLKKYSAATLSNWSHSFKGWKETKNGQVISYEYAKYLDIDSL